MDLGEAGNRAIWQVCGGKPRDRRLRRGYTHSPCPRDPHYVVWGEVLVGRGVGGVEDGTGGGSWSARKSRATSLAHVQYTAAANQKTAHLLTTK
jgi:hypothetical protein